jgi:glycosyltransferase involved in cell wall biosynthesis
VRAPVATRSGYGDMSRDIVRHLIEYDKFDVMVHSINWGETPMNALDESDPRDKMISDRIITGNINRQPDLYVSISIPSEFQPIGKYNIGITAGIETNAVSPQWIDAANQMDVVFVISEHSKNGFTMTKYQKKDTRTGQVAVVELNKPIEVLHNCVNTETFGKKAPTDYTFEKYLDKNVEDDFNFLFVGHWLRGEFGEDRKNVALLVKIFLEVFKQVKEKQPGLILKTSSAGFSILDREEILSKIDQIKKSVTLEAGQTLPNVYLLHGELTDKEMNTLYNHPKVKTHVSLTKGEGFGRPLLEASVSGKPVIASGWSGHMDFLNKDEAVLVGGDLKQIHASSVWENVLIPESSWFSPDHNQAANAMMVVFKDYTDFKNKAYNLTVRNRKDFSYEEIRKKTFELLDKYVPQFPTQIVPTLPKLKKIPKIEKETTE